MSKVILFGVNIRPLISFAIKYKIFLSVLLIVILHSLLFLSTTTLFHVDIEERSYYQNQEGTTYLYGLDPYHYYQQSNDIIQNKIDYNDADSSHSIIIALLQKIVGRFNFTLLQTMIWYSFFLILGLELVCFFFLRRLTNNYAALLGGILFVILLGNSGRILPGFVDTDPYNILFPIVSAWLLYEGFIRKSWTYFGFAGLTMGIFSSIWSGWWFFLYIALVSFLLPILYCLFGSDKPLKLDLINLTIFISSSLVFVSLFSSFSKFKQAFALPIPQQYASILGPSPGFKIYFILAVLVTLAYVLFRFLLRKRIQTSSEIRRNQLRKGMIALILIAIITFILYVPSFIAKSDSSIIPNTFSSIMELQPYDLSEIASGGIFVFLISLIGYFRFSFQRKTKVELFTNILFLSWFFTGLIATVLSQRFLVILIFPLTIGFTLLVKYLYDSIQTSKNIDRTIFTYLVLFPAFCLVLIFPLVGAFQEVYPIRPNFHDSWADSMDYLKDKSPPDSFVIAWWDFGYFTQAIADRDAAFDGGSQGSPTAYWLARAYTSSNARLSNGIFRMLACAKDPYLSKLDLASPSAWMQLEESLKLDQKEAKKYLDSNMLESTHCQPKESYVIVSSRMLYFSSLFSTGSWDLKRGEQYHAVKSLPMKQGISTLMASGLTSAQAAVQYEKIISQSYAEFMEEYVYFSPLFRCRKNSQELFDCGSMQITYEQHEFLNATIYEDHKVLNPQFFVGNLDGNVVRENFQDSESETALYFFNDGDEYFAVMATPQLLDSTFSNLLFFDGIYGMQKVYETGKWDRERIVVYKMK